MALPSPLPDDPRKWDGWSRYDSADLYERLGLSIEENPSEQLIEENCRQLLVWWQKKLPLKTQPSNPIAQLLRGGLDTAPQYLAEARSTLLNPEARQRIDESLNERRKKIALVEFQRFLDFALGKGVLTAQEETHLFRLGRSKGLAIEEMRAAIEDSLTRTGAQREADRPPPPAPAPVAPVVAAGAAAATGTRRVRREREAADPVADFKRMLRLSGLDDTEMTDDQRDAFINMAENLGLDPGDAEDIVDDYLEEMSQKSAPAPKTTPIAAARAANVPIGRESPPRNTPVVQQKPPIDVLTTAEERAQFRNFTNGIGCQMLLIPSAMFLLGSAAPDAPANEQPQCRVSLSRYYISRHAITNAQFEVFSPAHRTKRGAKAGDKHPVIYVSYLESLKFCQWLSARDKKRYRLPTEAEWEYAAKGADARSFPWGEETGKGNLANFADVNTNFAWSDPTIDDGWAETSPVGHYPLGASPFGLEDCAGNVWEWCLDYFEPYKGGERTNPRGPASGSQRVYRGGSWKSRFASLKTTTRGYNLPTYASNDVGFRVVCECD